MNAFTDSWRRSRTNAPPTQADIVRNDAILFVCVLLLLAAGWGVRLLAQPAHQRGVGRRLAGDLPTVERDRRLHGAHGAGHD